MIQIFTALFISFLYSGLAVEKPLNSFPSRTSLVVKANLNTLLNIPSIKKLTRDNTNTKLIELRFNIEGDIGLDIYKIDTLWFATGRQTETLALLQGHFDTLNIEKALRSHRQIKILKIAGVHFAGLFTHAQKPGEQKIIAVLNHDTLLIGHVDFTKEYLKVYTNKKPGLSETFQKKIALLEVSKDLLHALTINFQRPRQQNANPLLKNLTQAEISIKINKDAVKISIMAHMNENIKVNSTTLFLQAMLDKQKKSKRDQPIIGSLLRQSIISNNKQEIIYKSNLSLLALQNVLLRNILDLKTIF